MNDNKKLRALPAALAFAACAAHAHVTIAPATAPAGAYQTLALKVGHGCDGSATTGITVHLPEGLASAKPMPKAGWTIELVEGKFAAPLQLHGKTVTSGVRDITWRGGPLPDAYYDEFVLMVKLPDTAGRYVFKVGQQCEKGRVEWSDVPAAGTSSTTPAPVLDVLP
jgi:uncharacterized protein YcnI